MSSFLLLLTKVSHLLLWNDLVNMVNQSSD